MRRSSNYYDMIAFAMPEERSNAASYYMSNLSKLEMFISSFEQEHKELINMATSNKVFVPEHNRDHNYKELCLLDKQIPIIGSSGESYITPQELSCLRMRLEGYGYKEIAHILEISPRTVETN